MLKILHYSYCNNPEDFSSNCDNKNQSYNVRLSHSCHSRRICGGGFETHILLPLVIPTNQCLQNQIRLDNVTSTTLKSSFYFVFGST